MALISRFDPWRSSLCTCPPKLTFNPYTGCDHGCVYCYASSYVPKFSSCRPKKDLVARLAKETVKLRGELISISNSSDPYPTMEGKTALTRKCLKVLSERNCRLQVVTKSDLVVRDIDLLRKMPSMVSMTITTDDEATAEMIEPHAPTPSARLKAVEILIEKDVPASVRIDPVIPLLNDNQERLIQTLASLGVKHVTASTYKVKSDNWRRFAAAMPQIASRIRALYFEQGERLGSSIYLPRSWRTKLMEQVSASAKRFGVEFATCREGLNEMNTATCDGSWLISKNMSDTENG